MIYCASDRVGAFGETLAQFRVSLSTIANLSRDVEDEESSDSELEDIVDPQDSTRRVLLASEWCASRQVGHILIHNSLRFVDIMAAESLSHLRERPDIASVALRLGLPDIDIPAVTSGHRQLTQACARYIYEQSAADGTPLYAGIRYLSHYGVGPKWECWAIFSDRMIHHGDHADLTILPDDPGLLGAARIHNITIKVFDGYYLRP